MGQRDRVTEHPISQSTQGVGATEVLDRPVQVGDPIPAVCLVRDVARLLRVSESRVYQLRLAGKLRDFVLPSLDGTLRFNGRLLSAYRDGTFEPRALRLVGRKVR